ncbi:MAG: mechanosensitive ion channel, partial [Merismopedia sp. SIO2A8]|nr:mechanosensitive ion channel [Merismopedia sp. SIO2A8]
IRLIGWLTAQDGGVRLGIGLLKFSGVIFAAIIIAPKIGTITDKLLGQLGGMSALFRGFVVMIVKRGTLTLGALLALASLGANLGPILALVGGASFVLAFALQSNLGNFASGLMLMVNKPFDVGDEVKVAGYWAYVHSISLASTKLKDFDGNIVTLPNNTVWGGDIINYTHVQQRKIKLGIHIKFDQDIDQIKKMWVEIASSHPKVLQDPGPSIFPWNATYDFRIWVGLGAWAATEDYWEVYVDLLQGLQQKLEEINIELAATPVSEIQVLNFDETPSASLRAMAYMNESEPQLVGEASA